MLKFFPSATRKCFKYDTIPPYMGGPKVAVNVLVRDGPQILFILRKRTKTWALPGGHLELFESIEDCARREVFEETNLRIRNLALLGFSNDVDLEHKEHYIFFWVRADSDGGTLMIKEKESFQDISWFNDGSLPTNLFLPIKKYFEKTGFVPIKNSHEMP